MSTTIPQAPGQARAVICLPRGKKIYFDATLSAYSYEGEGLQQSAMGDGETMYCFLTGSDGVKSLTMTQETDPTAADRKLLVLHNSCGHLHRSAILRNG